MSRRLFGIIFLTTAGILLACATVLYVQLRTIGGHYAEHILSHSSEAATVVYDRRGREMGRFGRGRRAWVSMEEIPAVVQEVFVASEDQRFYHHWGIDPWAILRAARANLISGRIVEGASTITQQLVRNVLLSRERTLSRKLNEMLLALAIETQLSKEQILEAYLNQIDFGMGAVGIQAASLTYFGKQSKALQVHEAAVLAALIRAPSRYNPYRSEPDEWQGLQRQILRRWALIFGIDKQSLNDYLNLPLHLAPVANSLGEQGYALAYIARQLKQIYPNHDLHQSAWQIHSSIDLDRQHQLDQLMQALSLRLQSEANDLQMGACVIDPSQGEILALWGGADYFSSAFNRALDLRRPVGDLYLPFLYALAIDRGFHLSTSLYQPDNTLMRELGRAWPTLFDGLRFRLSFESSRLLMALGLGNYRQTMAKMDIDLHGEELDLLIDHQENSPCGLAAAFSVFWAGGVYHGKQLGTKILSADGKALSRWGDAPEQRVFEPATASILLEGLRLGQDDSPVDDRVPAFSGLSFSRGDFWMVQLHPKQTTAIWIGHKKGHALPESLQPKRMNQEISELLRNFVDVPAKLAKMLDINNRDVYFRRHVDLERQGREIFLPHRIGRVALRP